MHEEVYWLDTEADTERLAADWARNIKGPQIFALYGDLGAGKTTFVRAFVRALPGGDQVSVKSPSYALHHEYRTEPTVQHLDLYRLGEASQLEDLGLVELVLGAEGLVFIEWPEAMANALPATTLHLHFEVTTESSRKQLLLPQQPWQEQQEGRRLVVRSEPDLG